MTCALALLLSAFLFLGVCLGTSFFVSPSPFWKCIHAFFFRTRRSHNARRLCAVHSFSSTKVSFKYSLSTNKYSPAFYPQVWCIIEKLGIHPSLCIFVGRFLLCLSLLVLRRCADHKSAFAATFYYLLFRTFYYLFFFFLFCLSFLFVFCYSFRLLSLLRFDLFPPIVFRSGYFALHLIIVIIAIIERKLSLITPADNHRNSGLISNANHFRIIHPATWAGFLGGITAYWGL